MGALKNRVENGLKVIGTGYEGTFDEGEVVKIEIADGNVEKTDVRRRNGLKSVSTIRC